MYSTGMAENGLDQVSDDELFSNAFYSWLESHGVVLGELNTDNLTFSADVDLNRLKLAILRLKLEG